MTGFQLNIFGFYGAGAGLHLLQLLSDGAFAYAVDSFNQVHCSAGLGASTASNVTTSAGWATSSVVSSIPGTTQDVLTAVISGGATTGPTLQWSPFIVQNGLYSIYFVTPGCQIQGTCPSRGKVSVVVQPGQGGAVTTTVIDQTNRLDVSTLIFSGQLLASSATTGGATITVSLATGGAPTVGTTYELVAEKILLVAASTNGSAVATVQRGYGLFEYALGGGTGAFGDAVAAAANLNATATLQNSTGIDNLSFHLSANATVHSLVTIGTGAATRVFAGGNFVYTNGVVNSTNVISYSGASVVVPAPNGGLAGVVTSLVELHGFLYAAGTFVATVDGTVTGLDGAARWQYGSQGSSWISVGTVPAVGGSIAALGVANTGVNESLIALGGANAGLAIFDPSSNAWNSSAAGLIVGNLTAFGASPTPASLAFPSYFAGNIITAISMLSPGGALIAAGSRGQAELTSLSYKLSTQNITLPKSNALTTSSLHRSLVSNVVDMFSIRTLSIRGDIVERGATPINFTLPSALTTNPTASVLAGSFWQNGSQSLVVIGGEFTTSTGIQNIGLYDASAKTFMGIVGEVIMGTVKTIGVFGNIAWIGGSFTTDTGRQGLSTYDLGRMASNDSGPAFRGE